MKNSTINLTKGAACLVGAEIDGFAIYGLIKKTAEHCEKLGDVSSAPYCVGMGLTGLVLGIVGITLAAKGIEYFVKGVRTKPNRDITKEIARL